MKNSALRETCNQGFSRKASHDYANENGLPVIADRSKTYYISETRINGKVEFAVIKTDVDWNGTISVKNCTLENTDFSGYDEGCS